MSEARIREIERRLREALSPTELRIKDQSHLHAGHAGARDGLGHFDVFIVSEAFEGVSRVRRHQMVYAALGELMKTDIHALAIHASATENQT